jgi:hypothetical protein
VRGAITGLATTVGGMLHTLPFLIAVLSVAYVVVVIDPLAIAYIRCHFMKSPLAQTVGQVIVGGGIIFALGIWLGRVGASQ